MPITQHDCMTELSASKYKNTSSSSLGSYIFLYIWYYVAVSIRPILTQFAFEKFDTDNDWWNTVICLFACFVTYLVFDHYLNVYYFQGNFHTHTHNISPINDLQDAR